jgi:hypothetical protein
MLEHWEELRDGLAYWDDGRAPRRRSDGLFLWKHVFGALWSRIYSAHMGLNALDTTTIPLLALF